MSICSSLELLLDDFYEAYKINKRNKAIRSTFDDNFQLELFSTPSSGILRGNQNIISSQLSQWCQKNYVDLIKISAEDIYVIGIALYQMDDQTVVQLRPLLMPQGQSMYDFYKSYVINAYDDTVVRYDNGSIAFTSSVKDFSGNKYDLIFNRENLPIPCFLKMAFGETMQISKKLESNMQHDCILYFENLLGMNENIATMLIKGINRNNIVAYTFNFSKGQNHPSFDFVSLGCNVDEPEK